MSDAPSHDTPSEAPEAPERQSRLDTEVDGRPVRFWIAVGVVIALVVLGVGAWWVWGLDRGMPTEGTAMGMLFLIWPEGQR